MAQWRPSSSARWVHRDAAGRGNSGLGRAHLRNSPTTFRLIKGETRAVTRTQDTCGWAELDRAVDAHQQLAAGGVAT